MALSIYLWTLCVLFSVAESYKIRFSTDPVDHMEIASQVIDVLKPRPVWPPDEELNGRQSILIGYLTSGDVVSRLPDRGRPFYEPQTAFFNDGALSVAIEEINNSTEILPNHMVSVLPPQLIKSIC